MATEETPKAEWKEGQWDEHFLVLGQVRICLQGFQDKEGRYKFSLFSGKGREGATWHVKVATFAEAKKVAERTIRKSLLASLAMLPD